MLLLIVTVAASGCSQPIYEVSGKVTCGGVPVPAGKIWFDPDVTKKNDGPQGYAEIVNGKYSTAAEGGKAVIGGPFTVRIFGYDGKPVGELPRGQPLFSTYQQQVDLPKESCTKDFDVPAP